MFSLLTLEGTKHNDNIIATWRIIRILQHISLIQILYITCIAGSLCYCLTGNKSDEEIYKYIRGKTITRYISSSDLFPVKQ